MTPSGSRSPVAAAAMRGVDLDAENAELRHQVLLGIGRRRHGIEVAALLDRPRR